MNILIADDELPARSELHYILETLIPDAEFEEATNGEQALRLIEKSPVDVVFLDIRMPDLTGFDVLARLPAHLQPAVIFVTAYDEFALRAFEVHAVDYLLKPFGAERLADSGQAQEAHLAHATWVRRLVEQAATAPAPAAVSFDDETLRDGLQSPSARHPSLEERLRFLELYSQNLAEHTTLFPGIEPVLDGFWKG